MGKGKVAEFGFRGSLPPVLMAGNDDGCSTKIRGQTRQHGTCYITRKFVHSKFIRIMKDD